MHSTCVYVVMTDKNMQNSFRNSLASNINSAEIVKYNIKGGFRKSSNQHTVYCTFRMSEFSLRNSQREAVFNLYHK